MTDREEPTMGVAVQPTGLGSGTMGRLALLDVLRGVAILGTLADLR